jgi:hypothetical protein
LEPFLILLHGVDEKNSNGTKAAAGARWGC